MSRLDCSLTAGVAAVAGVAGVAGLQADEWRPLRAHSLGAASALKQRARPRVNSLSFIMIVLTPEQGPMLQLI